jgi:hypothetical protein
MKNRSLNIIRLTDFSGRTGGLYLSALLALLAFAAPAADPGRTNRAPAKLSFSEFSIISDRNIFNTKRYARNSNAPVVRRDNSRSARVEYFALLGIISYEKGPFAFFDGSSSTARKSARINDEICGFKIKSILPNAVHIESGTNHFELPLGKQLRRSDGGPWEVADRIEVSYASNERRSDDRAYGGRDRDRRDSFPRETERGNDGGSFESPSVMIMQPGGEGPTVISLPNGELPQPTAEGLTIQIQGAPVAPAAPAGEGAENEVLRRLMQRREQELNR